MCVLGDSDLLHVLLLIEDRDSNIFERINYRKCIKLCRFDDDLKDFLCEIIIYTVTM